MSHTPGPWVVWGASSNDGEAEVISNEDGSKTVCWTADTYSEDEDEGVVTDEDRANGRLIAAAPDLLASCKKLIAFEEALSCIEGFCYAWKEACEAIAKAEGRSE